MKALPWGVVQRLIKIGNFQSNKFSSVAKERSISQYGIGILTGFFRLSALSKLPFGNHRSNWFPLNEKSILSENYGIIRVQYRI